MSWLLAVTPFAVGLVLGASTRIRVAFLALPPLALGLVYWIVVGWNGDDYDMGRAGAILFTGIFAAAFVLVWVAGCAVGRIIRSAVEPPASSGQESS